MYNENAQGGVESKEFGFLVRHPGPSPDFFPWALDMKLKVIGVDCGCAEHPMNTNIRYMHENEFKKAEAKLMRDHGKSWDEMFPPDEYYQLTHITMPKAHLLLAESIVGDVDKLNNQRAWIMIHPIPFMEVESAWSRVCALRPPEGISEDEFFQIMASADMLDLTIPFSVRTPQWANYVPLTVTYTKRVGGQSFGMGRNGSICNASIHLGTHMDGEKHFWPAGRTIGEVPLEEWVGPGVIADISHLVSDCQRLHTGDDRKRGRGPRGRHPHHQDRLAQVWLDQPGFGRVPLHDQAPGTIARFFSVVCAQKDKVAGHRRRKPGPPDEHHPAHLAPQDL